MWHHHLTHVMDGLSLRRGPVRAADGTHEDVVIRAASAADLPQVSDLAELDSAPPLSGPVLVAAVDGRMWAALSLDSGRVVADPFYPTAGAVGLLRLRARQLRDVSAGRSAPHPHGAARRARA